MSNLDNVNICGISEIIISILLVFFGTGYSIASKVMMSITCIDDDDGSPREETFHKPLFVTFGMFLALMLVLPMHWTVVMFKLDFPGYTFGEEMDYYDTTEKNGAKHQGKRSKDKSSDTLVAAQKTPMRTYFILAIPAILDLVSITMFTIGLQYLDVSIYSTLRGSAQIIFVALFKQYVWKQCLLKFHWVGVFWTVVSAVLVGMAAVIASERGQEGRKYVSLTETVLGVCLTLSGAIAQALTAVTEEHVMKMDNPAPPLLLIGMKGMP